jgi:hypothetical protein
MDHSVLIIEAPKMNDENIAKLHDFIHELLRAFEGHYYHQLVRHERSKKVCENHSHNFPEDQDPF